LRFCLESNRLRGITEENGLGEIRGFFSIDRCSAIWLYADHESSDRKNFYFYVERLVVAYLSLGGEATKIT